MSDDMREETVESLLEQWFRCRSSEEWVMSMIVQTRGTARSALKRQLKEIRKSIKRIEKELFNA